MEFCLIWHCSRRWDAISTDPAGFGWRDCAVHHRAGRLAAHLLAPQSAEPVYSLGQYRAGNRITGAVNHYYGKKIGNLITGLYFLAFFVVVLIYAVAITNSLAEQVAHRTPMTPGLRALLSLGSCWSST